MSSHSDIARLRVLQAGPHVTVQDGGRTGLKRFGVPASGPMDRKSFAIANAVLGNPVGQVAIEVSVGGLSLQCESGAMTLAVTGGGFQVRAGRRSTGSWAVCTLRAGETLVIQPGVWGSWCYLAFAGTLEAPEWLGSRATHASSGLGGGAVRAGQELQVQQARVVSLREADIPCPVWARPARSVQCVLGPQDRFFAPETLATFTATRYALTHTYDRMGVRLHGPALRPLGALSIPSEPIVRGAVQVSGDGSPTVLLADHQTTGGYPKIATLLSDDVDRLVQCRPPDSVAFEPVSPAQAIAQRRFRARQQHDYLQRLAARFGVVLA